MITTKPSSRIAGRVTASTAVILRFVGATDQLVFDNSPKRAESSFKSTGFAFLVRLQGR